MSKTANNWEISASALIPYLKWGELYDGKSDVWKTGRHNHACYELHIILSGECSIFINNSVVNLSAGQVLLISPEAFHAPKSVTQPFRRLSVSFLFDESNLSNVIPKNSSFSLFSADDTIKELCSAIFTEAKNENSPFHQELLSGLFAQLMLRILRSIKESNKDSAVSLFHPEQLEDMSTIDVFFVKTPPKLRTKERLANLLHCSERQVLRKIYTLYGMSFQEKQILSKIDTAQHLLRISDKSVEEICTLVGYSDKAAFYKAFKLYTNTTPVKYSKLMKIQYLK